MAVFRIAPKCLKCGKEYKAIHRHNDGSFIGDDFIKWDIEGHVCGKAPAPNTSTAEETVAEVAVRRFNERLGTDKDGAYYLGFKDGVDWQASTHSAPIEMLEQEIKLLDSEKSDKDKSIERLTKALESITTIGDRFENTVHEVSLIHEIAREALASVKNKTV